MERLWQAGHLRLMERSALCEAMVLVAAAAVEWVLAQVRLCAAGFPYLGDLGYRGEGARWGRIQVHCISGPCHPPPVGGGYC